MKAVLRVAAKPDAVDELKAIFAELARSTRQEPGCVSYEVLQNVADPCDFTFVEEWVSAEALDAHWRTPHVEKALARGLRLLASPPDDRRYLKIA